MKDNEMIKWNELDDYVGKPVWNAKKQKWRVLIGYSRVNKNYYLKFTDNDYSVFIDDSGFEEVNKNKLNLYPEEKK